MIEKQCTSVCAFILSLPKGAADLEGQVFRCLRSQPVWFNIPRPPSKKQGSRLSILLALAVMLNAVLT